MLGRSTGKDLTSRTNVPKQLFLKKGSDILSNPWSFLVVVMAVAESQENKNSSYSLILNKKELQLQDENKKEMNVSKLHRKWRMLSGIIFRWFRFKVMQELVIDELSVEHFHQ